MSNAVVVFVIVATVAFLACVVLGCLCGDPEVSSQEVAENPAIPEYFQDGVTPIPKNPASPQPEVREHMDAADPVRDIETGYYQDGITPMTQ